MKWFFFNTGFNTGIYNMQFDLQLLQNCSDDETYFRLYRWKPYCISLGANQRTDALDLKKLNEDKIHFVTRPTGGRAVLHSEELTYSLVMPVNAAASVRKIYFEINTALGNGLTAYDERLKDIELEDTQPSFPSHYKQPGGEICFSVSAKNEIKFGGKKLAGSAQRKFGGFILQHGSILCGGKHKDIINYLNLAADEFREMRTELDKKTTDLMSILNEEVDYNRLAGEIAEAVQAHFRVSFENIKTGKISAVIP